MIGQFFVELSFGHLLQAFVQQTRVVGLSHRTVRVRQLLQLLPATVDHVDAVGHAVRTAGTVAETLAAGALVPRTAARLIASPVRRHTSIAAVWRCQLELDVRLMVGQIVLQRSVPTLVERVVDEEEMHLHKGEVHVASQDRRVERLR